MSPVRGVIFDVDGTLIDSNDAHTRAWVEILEQAGFKASFAQIRDLIGMGGDKLIPTLTGWDPESPEAKELGQKRTQLFFDEYAPRLRAFPDVRRLFERLRGDGISLYIATSAKEKELSVLLDIAGIADLLSDTATSSDAANSKPDPDIIQAAVRQSGLDRSELVMVGDTPYDIEASTRAGVRSIGFRCGGWTEDVFAGAVRVFDGAWDMLAQYADVERLFGLK